MCVCVCVCARARVRVRVRFNINKDLFCPPLSPPPQPSLSPPPSLSLFLDDILCVAYHLVQLSQPGIVPPHSRQQQKQVTSVLSFSGSGA